MTEIYNIVSFESVFTFYSEAIFNRYKTSMGFQPIVVEFHRNRFVDGGFDVLKTVDKVR